MHSDSLHYFRVWNLNRDGGRRPNSILFLADRNILANQAYNSFDPFEEDVLKRLKPSEIKKKGSVPMNASIFFTIFQTFMSGRDEDGNPIPTLENILRTSLTLS